MLQVEQGSASASLRSDSTRDRHLELTNGANARWCLHFRGVWCSSPGGFQGCRSHWPCRLPSTCKLVGVTVEIDNARVYARQRLQSELNVGR